MKCFYHSADFDGKCSGAIVLDRYPQCEMIGINYGDAFPWDAIESHETIFMVDFCLQPFDDMLRLDLIAHLTWIDHHKSAIEEAATSDAVIAGMRAIGQAGCELTWRYFYNDSPMPWGVRLLGRYDVWDHRDPDVLPFQYGLRLHSDTTPNAPFWDEVLSNSAPFVRGCIDRGNICLSYKRQSDAVCCTATAFPTELDGLRCIALNAALANSQTFASVWDPEQYDAMLAFYWTAKGFWTVSLYVNDRDDVDVSLVAKAHGGGGHTRAAGFQCQTLPFDLRAGTKGEGQG